MRANADSATGKVVQTAAHRTAMDVLVVAPDGRRFAEAGMDKKVRIRDAATLAIVLDGSAAMAPHREALASAMRVSSSRTLF